MQVQVEVSPERIVRIQRDGPSPAAQAAEALAQDYRTEIANITAQLRELNVAGRRLDPSQRAELSRLRMELQEASAKLQGLEAQQAEYAIEGAAQAMAAQALGGREHEYVTTTPMSRGDDIPDIPPRVSDVSMMFILCLAAAIILTPLMRAFGRMLERRVPQHQLPPEVTSQLARMEQAIEAVAVEVERVSEGQRFATKLLAEREGYNKVNA